MTNDNNIISNSSRVLYSSVFFNISTGYVFGYLMSGENKISFFLFLFNVFFCLSLLFYFIYLKVKCDSSKIIMMYFKSINLSVITIYMMFISISLYYKGESTYYYISLAIVQLLIVLMFMVLGWSSVDKIKLEKHFEKIKIENNNIIINDIDIWECISKPENKLLNYFSIFIKKIGINVFYMSLLFGGGMGFILIHILNLLKRSNDQFFSHVSIFFIISIPVFFISLYIPVTWMYMRKFKNDLILKYPDHKFILRLKDNFEELKKQHGYKN